MKIISNIKIKLKKNKIFAKIIFTIKYSLLYYYVLLGSFQKKNIQKICFFYKPEVPNFGNNFTYIKLGQKEKIFNPNNYSVIFEADLPDNLSRYNKHFMDYSGLYAIYKNDLIKKDNIFLIHYDTQIRHKRWAEIIEANVKKNNVVFSTWEIDKERSDVAKWVYDNIDRVFLKTYKKTFLSFLKENKFYKLPNSSQFACKKETFMKMMDFLIPIYNFILHENKMNFRYAHLLERAWGLFFALRGYKVVGVIKDSHSQSDNSVKNIVNIPILSVAIERNVEQFSELF